MTTDSAALYGEPDPVTGYRRLRRGAGWPHIVRTDLAAPHPMPDSDDREVLLTIAHLSDLHVCDSQSPARIEFMDRWADPDSPILEFVGEVGTYRAQDMLTAQVVDSCVRAVNAVATGPVGGAVIDLAIVTGDNTDNAQANELDWYVTLLDGGRLQPDSGDRSRYEGVADSDCFDERFWHPDADREDLPRSRYGFPRAPGLLDALRAPFTAAGLAMEWLAVHGNHDQLVQGTIVGDRLVSAAAVGDVKPIGLPPDVRPLEVVALLDGLADARADAVMSLAGAVMRPITADPARRLTTRAEFVGAHFGASARPHGHGFGSGNRDSGLAYYRQDRGRVTVLVLDTVNEYGGWQGSLDTEQFDWLASELAAADRERRYVVLASHHPLETIINSAEGGAGRRVLGPEIERLLARHGCVVLWLAGHTHQVSIAAASGYWQVVAPSLIDWPQQARIVEILRVGGQLRIAATMLDHRGSAPWDMALDSIDAIAGLSRELAANDWQWLSYPLADHPRGGSVDARNVILLLDDPWA